jgi:hypothetical protein
MQTLSRLSKSPLAFIVFAALWFAVFLLAVGLDGESLPFTRNSEYSDAVTSHYPNALIIHRFLHREGTLANPYVMGDQPWLPNPLNKAYYPLQWLVAVFPPILHLNIMLWLHLIIAAVGMRQFARALTFSPEVAALMGLAFAFTPRLIAAAGAGHLDIVMACAWFPCVMLAVHHLPNVRAVIGLGGASALLFLADVRIFALVMVVAGLYCVYLILASFPVLKHRAILKSDASILSIAPAFKPGEKATNDEGEDQRAILPSPFAERGWGVRFFVAFLIGLFLAMLLTAPLWAQLLAELPNLSRAGLTEADAGAGSLSIIELMLGSLIGIQGGAHESMNYLGVPILALALIAAFTSPRRVWFWMMIVIGFALWSLGTNFILWQALVRVFPFLLWLRVPARGWLIVAFGAIILAGYGLRVLLERRETSRTIHTPIRIIVLGIGIVGLACTVLAARFSFGNAVIAGAIIGITCLLLLNWRRLTPAVWAILIIVDLTILNTTLIDGVRREDWLDRYQPLVSALQTDQVDHVYSPTYSLPQQVAVYYRIPIIGGIDPFQYADYVRRFEAATGVVSKGYSVTLPAFDTDPEFANKTAVMNLDALAAMQVSHVIAAYPIMQPGLTLLSQDNQVYIYRNTRYAAPR